jgi:hypothetical protein
MQRCNSVERRRAPSQEHQALDSGGEECESYHLSPVYLTRFWQGYPKGRPLSEAGAEHIGWAFHVVGQVWVRMDLDRSQLHVDLSKLIERVNSVRVQICGGATRHCWNRQGAYSRCNEIAKSHHVGERRVTVKSHNMDPDMSRTNSGCTARAKHSHDHFPSFLLAYHEAFRRQFVTAYLH